MPPVTCLFLLILLSVSAFLVLSEPRETQEEKNTLWKERGISLHIISLLPASDFPSFLASCGTNGCFFKKMRYPRLLTQCIDMFHISLCAYMYVCVCVSVCLSWETNVTRWVSAAEKSMTTQPFYFRKPMMGWLTTQVCVSALTLCAQVYECLCELVSTSSSSLQHRGITRFFMATATKYAYLSANPH